MKYVIAEHSKLPVPAPADKTLPSPAGAVTHPRWATTAPSITKQMAAGQSRHRTGTCVATVAPGPTPAPGRHLVSANGFLLESTRTSARAGDGLALPAAPSSSLLCWFSSCSSGVAPVGCPCHGGDAASSGLTSCRSTWGRWEVSAQLQPLYFPGKDLCKANPRARKINKINSCNFNNHCVGFGRCYSS